MEKMMGFMMDRTSKADKKEMTVQMDDGKVLP
jgi:hypothetical protein